MDATLGARFCRTCGARLVPESEVTAGDTKQYSPQQAAAAEYAAPPLINADPFAPAPDTARLYQQQPQQPYPYQIEKPKRSWKAVWITLAVVLALFIGGLAVVAIRIGQQVQRTIAVERPPVRGIPGGVPAPPHPPDAPLPPGAAALSIEELKYPGATIDKEITIVGQEILIMTTEDDLLSVRDHYQEIFGDQARIEEKTSETVAFITPGDLPTVVKLERISREPNKVRIEAVRTGIPSPETLFKQKKSGESVPVPSVPADLQRQIQEAIRQTQEAMRQAEEAKRQAERQRQP
jgi:hypothetical protein